MEKVIDAKGKKIGRVATEIAMALMGKDEAGFENNKVADVKVIVNNASKADISPKKLKEKQYSKFSGYPGGLKFENMEKIIKEKGYVEVYKKAVRGMLPANRLRKLSLKNLTIND